MQNHSIISLVEHKIMGPLVDHLLQMKVLELQIETGIRLYLLMDISQQLTLFIITLFMLLHKRVDSTELTWKLVSKYLFSLRHLKVIHMKGIIGTLLY